MKKGPLHQQMKKALFGLLEVKNVFGGHHHHE
jgi:hypothetical protein